MNEKARNGVNALVDLLPSLFEKVGIIVIAAFLLSYMKPFRQMIGHEHEMSKKIMFIALFGTFGIISNYTGIEIGNHAMPEGDWHAEIAPDNAIANTRIMGVAIGGLLGGPFVGLGVGLIAGLHRYFLGGFTAGACAIAAILAGVLSGFLGKRRRKHGTITPWFALPICMALEAIQMGIILVTAKPFERAWELVQVIGTSHDHHQWIRDFTIHAHHSVDHEGRSTDSGRTNQSCVPDCGSDFALFPARSESNFMQENSPNHLGAD